MPSPLPPRPGACRRAGSAGSSPGLLPRRCALPNTARPVVRYGFLLPPQSWHVCVDGPGRKARSIPISARACGVPWHREQLSRRADRPTRPRGKNRPEVVNAGRRAMATMARDTVCPRAAAERKQGRIRAAATGRDELGARRSWPLAAACTPALHCRLEVPERSKARARKACRRETVSGVGIPFSPPAVQHIVVSWARSAPHCQPCRDTLMCGR